MKKLIVGAALLAAVALPVHAQVEESASSGKSPAVFHFTPYVGYIIYGDHFNVPDGEYTSDNAAGFGAQIALDVAPNFALFANGMYSKTNFEIEPTGGGEIPVSGDLGLWFYDAGVEFKLPFGRGQSTFTPFAQAGLGAIKFSAESDDIRSDGATNIAYNVGLGFDAQVSGLGVRIMAKDYISSFDWDELDDLGGSADVSNNFAITIGLKFSF